MKYRDENGQWQDILLPATGDTYPIGSMAPFAGIVVPTNWLKCDGSQYNKSDYPELYKVIGDTWNLEGDNDDTKFRVPDMSERAAIGATNEFPVGTLLGEKEVQLTIDEMPKHRHQNTNKGLEARIGGWEYNEGTDRLMVGNLGYVIETPGPAGGDQPHNNIPPSAATMYIIKAKNSAGFLGVVTEDISDENENAVPSAETVKEYVDNQIQSDDGYIKFPDGTMMCFGNFRVDKVTTEAWGNIASQKVLNPVTFPAPFTEIFSVTATCSKSQGYGFWVHRVVYNTEKIESMEISRATAVSNVDSNFSYVAMGRWK